MRTATPVASYRLQLTPEHGLGHALGLLDHLEALGVSHVYLSPIAEAIPGSGHGYDVVDHTQVRAEFGGATALDALLDAAAHRDMRVVIDHVPNHASTSRPELNAPWWEMLRDGPDAPGARWFDVDWAAHDQRVLLPVLGAPLDEVRRAGGITVDGDELVVHGGLRLPLASGTADLEPDLDGLLERQHYRLLWWRDPRRNVRRFFTIDDLVAVRAEESGVADELDTLVTNLAGRSGFGGVRVDHVDGLADPLGYLVGLRERVGEHAWLLVEKILAPDETLPPAWPVDGTTGYEFARVLDQVMLVTEAVTTFDRLWARCVAGHEELQGSFHELEDRARREVLATGLRPDVERTVAAAARGVGELPGLERVVVELIARLPRYRTYLPDDPAGTHVLESVVEGLAHDLASERSDHVATCRRVASALRSPATDAEIEFRTRWQQLTGPAMAKGAEDRAFYRYLRFAAACEVGGEPGRFGVPVDEFHAAQRTVQTSHPLTMLAASTHDTKRSADVRARAAALTAEHRAWSVAVDDWWPAIVETVPGIDLPTVSLAVQTAVTCPGLDPDRLAAFLVKSAREADLRTSWTDQHDGYETSLADLADVVVGDHAVASSIREWSRRLDRPGRAASVAATVARLTAPGVADVYQGTEAFEYHLVDPDNRAAPDWDELRSVVAAAGVLDGPSSWREQHDASKAVVIRRLTALRRAVPDAFGPAGTYTPLVVSGPGADRVLAFARGDAVVTVVALPGIRLDSIEQLRVELPEGTWHHVLDDRAAPATGHLALASALREFPAVVLRRS